MNRAIGLGPHHPILTLHGYILLQRLTTDVVGGSTPDLAIIGTRWLLDFASQGVAEPLDGYMTREFKGTFIDTFMGPGLIDGKLMGLPVAVSARAMMINKDIYDKAGVTAPATWDELYADAQKVKAAVPDAFAFGLQGTTRCGAWRQHPERRRHQRHRQPGRDRGGHPLQEDDRRRSGPATKSLRTRCSTSGCAPPRSM